MKELIIVANGQTGCQIADQLWDILGQENQIQDSTLQNKENEFSCKSFYYETQDGSYIPRAIFMNHRRKKIQGIQVEKSDSFRQLAEKCDYLHGYLWISGAINNDMKLVNEQFPKTPQLTLTAFEEPISIHQQIQILETYKTLNIYSEASIVVDIETLLKQEQKYEQKIAQMINTTLIGLNQPYKKHLDIFSLMNEQRRFYSCGYDQNIYSKNYSGVQYDQGKFNSINLLSKGDISQEIIKQSLEYTKNVHFGIYEKQSTSVCQISDHSENLWRLKSILTQIQGIPKYYKKNFEMDDSLNELVDLYK
ncbi:alpha-tubulin [Paramecium bursaria]